MDQTRTASARFTIYSPADGSPVADYPLMTAADVDRLVQNARRAFDGWSRSTLKERRRILRRAAAVLADHAEQYAAEIAAENGKTAMDAMLADIFSTAHLLTHNARKLSAYLKPVRTEGTWLLPGRKSYYVFEPRGVIGIVSPWNYPLTLSAGPVISAIAAGNTAVLKPSSQTTRSGLIVKEIFDKAGLPKDVLHVVTGSGSLTGEALVNHPELDMLFFTGSTDVGRKVNIKAAEQLIPAIMELGGKDVAIVTRNADLDRAANGVNWGAFTNCGQTCIGTELILVDRAVYKPFVEKLTELVNRHRPGRNASEIGAMTMDSQLQIVEEQLADAIAKGAKVLTGGRRGENKDGRFFYPTLLEDTTPEMTVRKEETFGPLKPIIPFDSIDEAISIANDSEFGLSGAVFTKDMEEGRAIARRLQTGSVNINDALITYALPSLPFGGVKQSGTGRYHGAMGLQAFTHVKSITEFKWNVKRDLYWYPRPAESDRLLAEALVAIFSRNPFKRIGSAVTVIRMLRKQKQKRRDK